MISALYPYVETVITQLFRRYVIAGMPVDGKTKDRSLARFVCPPAFVHFTIVICVYRDCMKTTYKTLSCIWVAVPVDRVILHWYACGADGRSGGGSVGVRSRDCQIFSDG